MKQVERSGMVRQLFHDKMAGDTRLGSLPRAIDFWNVDARGGTQRFSERRREMPRA